MDLWKYDFIGFMIWACRGDISSICSNPLTRYLNLIHLHAVVAPWIQLTHFPLGRREVFNIDPANKSVLRNNVYMITYRGSLG